MDNTGYYDVYETFPVAILFGKKNPEVYRHQFIEYVKFFNKNLKSRSEKKRYDADEFVDWLIKNKGYKSKAFNTYDF
jgi:hypothetical protein